MNTELAHEASRLKSNIIVHKQPLKCKPSSDISASEDAKWRHVVHPYYECVKKYFLVFISFEEQAEIILAGQRKYLRGAGSGGTGQVTLPGMPP